MSSADETTDGPDTSELSGAWTLEYVEDRPVVDRSPAYIEFDAEGRVSGQASCNRMTGSYTLDGAGLTLSPLAVTRMMCPEALMEQEQRVLAALEKVASWRIEDGMLMLEDEDGGQLFRASPREEEP
jgi:heat shock protein HslJ